MEYYVALKSINVPFSRYLNGNYTHYYATLDKNGWRKMFKNNENLGNEIILNFKNYCTSCAISKNKGNNNDDDMNIFNYLPTFKS